MIKNLDEIGIPTDECDGRHWGHVDEPCWGEVKRYSVDGDRFCEGHWEEREGNGYLREPPRLHGPRVIDEMGRPCVLKRPDQPCWGKIERYGDADDTYCEAHHPMSGVYGAVYNAGSQQTFERVTGWVEEELAKIETRLSACIHHLGTGEDCNGPEAVKADLWDLLTTVERLRRGGES